MAVSAPAFAGFSRDSITFMEDLARNNDRAWFQPRKAEFERLLKEPMEELCIALAARFESRGIPLLADPRRSPFRIYCDTRFSADKSPYKEHLAASFAGTEAASGAGGYFNFQPGEMYVGGGMYRPDRSRLEAFRKAVRDEPDRVRAALEDPGFVAEFGGVEPHDEPLKRVPAGYPADHPMADLLRWKDVIFGRRLSDAEVLSPTLPDTLANAYAAALPVFRFLAALR